MRQLVTQGIILSRTEYGEADRIITVLTPEQGKLRLIAKGVRRMKSKMAGGIDLFTVSDLTYIPGKGEIGTLISSRMQRHYGEIVKDLDRVQLGYELIKLLNKATEDNPEAEYFELLQQAFAALDTTTNLDLINIWFQTQVVRQAGHSPNLQTDTDGQKLSPDQTYSFDFESMTFTSHPDGHFSAPQIKALRLLFDGYAPSKLARVQGILTELPDLLPLVHSMLITYIRT